MWGVITTRTKVLIAAAIICLAYVLLTRESSDPVELTHAIGPRTRHVVAAPSFARADTAGLVRSLMNRGVLSAQAAWLFSPQSWYVAPALLPATAAQASQASTVPKAPPLPFTFLGSYQLDAATPVFYLSAGDRVFDVKIGDMIDNTYSLDAIKDGQLLFTYIPLKIQQSLAMSEAQ